MCAKDTLEKWDKLLEVTSFSRNNKSRTETLFFALEFLQNFVVFTLESQQHCPNELETINSKMTSAL